MPALIDSLQLQIDRDGFAMNEHLVPQSLLREALIEAEHRADPHPRVRSRRGAVFAVRNALEASAALRAIAECEPLRNAVTEIIGEGAFLTRAILFDKNPQANWGVPWHQDVTIAVRTRLDAPGFGPWSEKAGVVHVQPPSSVLERMLTARIHLDDCGAENGALRVIPGSHKFGLMSSEQILQLKSQSARSCSASAGDVLFIRPLILHASAPATSPRHRRILHVEFATDELPFGLEWYRA